MIYELAWSEGWWRESPVYPQPGSEDFWRKKPVSHWARPASAQQGGVSGDMAAEHGERQRQGDTGDGE